MAEERKKESWRKGGSKDEAEQSQQAVQLWSARGVAEG